MLDAIPRLHALPPSSDFFWVQPKKVALFLRPKKAKKVGRGGRDWGRGRAESACCFWASNCTALASQSPRQWHTELGSRGWQKKVGRGSGRDRSRGG